MQCFICNGTGLKTISRQGDLANAEQILEANKSGMTCSPCYYATTMYVTCDCRIVNSLSFRIIPIQNIFRRNGITDHLFNW